MARHEKLQVNDRVKIIDTSWRGDLGTIIDVVERIGRATIYEILTDEFDIICLKIEQIEKVEGL